MDWKTFHHPDWSLPVVRRRACDHWMDLLSDVGAALATNGRSLTWNQTYPNSTAYYNAMSRLRKAGLVVRSDNDGMLPHLKLTEAGHNKLPIYHRPEKLWNTRWNGIWYVLIFDVPERERHYRDKLRVFLKSLRMGCLQKSVWITPFDIRPEYNDLQQAASINAVSYLLESRTVLNQETQELVRDAWDFRFLEELHSRYLSVYGENLQWLEDSTPDPQALMNLLHQEAEAYVQCMCNDPLLPTELHPPDYLGKQVFALHQNLRQSIAKHL